MFLRFDMSHSALMPRLFRLERTLRPFLTKDLFKPFKGTTSHTVPSATKSKSLNKSGSLIFLKISLFLNSLFNPTNIINVTPAAERYS